MLSSWKRRNRRTLSNGGLSELPSSPGGPSKLRSELSRKRNLCALIAGILILAWVLAYAQSVSELCIPLFILRVRPGGTGTRIAVFLGRRLSVRHPAVTLA